MPQNQLGVIGQGFQRLNTLDHLQQPQLGGKKWWQAWPTEF
jgi:hypothetical protein